MQPEPVVGDPRERPDATPGEQVHEGRAAPETQEPEVLEHLVHRQRARAGLMAVIRHQDDEVVVVGALEERPELLVEQAVDAADAIGDRRRRRFRVTGMPRMDVLEQAVLEPVGGDEDDAGDIPGLLVEERPHRRGALADQALEVGDQVERTVSERRPGAAVDRPAEPRARRLAGG